jgi:hypothetical protein
MTTIPDRSRLTMSQRVPWPAELERCFVQVENILELTRRGINEPARRPRSIGPAVDERLGHLISVDTRPATAVVAKAHKILLEHTSFDPHVATEGRAMPARGKHRR